MLLAVSIRILLLAALIATPLVTRVTDPEPPADSAETKDAPPGPAPIEPAADDEVAAEPESEEPPAKLPAPPKGVVYQDRETGYFTGAWQVERGWDRQAEIEFGEFVRAIGLAREKRGFTFEQAVRSKRTNPLWSEEDATFRVMVDCATFPYLVRSYFAFKTRRPFSWHSNKGRRYSKENKPRRYSDWSMFESPEKFFGGLDASVSSAHFRMDATLEGTDTYPIDITQESLIPGTVYYDPNGHVLLVYDVDHYSGDVLFLDAHPDGTMTIREFGKQYAIGRASLGGGFRAWRHYDITLQNKQTGAFRIVRKSNAESDFYSATAQYLWDFKIDEHTLDYWEWVRARVSTNGIYFYPIEDFNLMLDEICQEIQFRVNSVDVAMQAGMHTRKHPNELPYNIYGAAGDWENYSTPGRDVRIRSAFREAFAYVIKTMELSSAGSSRLKYKVEPWELYKEYLRIWNDHDVNTLCRYKYTNSDGDEVTFALSDVAARLFDLSFDPYHCPELRWGARPNSNSESAREEFKSCPEDNRKYYWYEQENRLRNRMTRLIGKGTGTHRGPTEPPDISIPRLLDCYAEHLPQWDKCHTRTRLKASGVLQMDD